MIKIKINKRKEGKNEKEKKHSAFNSLHATV